MADQESMTPLKVREFIRAQTHLTDEEKQTMYDWYCTCIRMLWDFEGTPTREIAERDRKRLADEYGIIL